VAFLGAEPQRATEIAFTAAYLEIPATYLVPAGSPIRSIAEVDREGVRIAVAEKSAYELWLSRNIKQRQARAHQRHRRVLNVRERQARGALGPAATAADRRPEAAGRAVLDGQFTAVQQASAPQGSRQAAARSCATFVEDVKASGFVGEAITRNGSQGVTVRTAGEVGRAGAASGRSVSTT
jgi:polar amino acid transport system substrate-binding protein